jgi:hypothetical protein
MRAVHDAVSLHSEAWLFLHFLYVRGWETREGFAFVAFACTGKRSEASLFLSFFVFSIGRLFPFCFVLWRHFNVMGMLMNQDEVGIGLDY